MIYENIPWDNNGNIADAYNAFMDKLNDEDWAVFRDADTFYTTSHYGKQLYDAIDKYPGVRAFTCLTNRTNCTWQKVEEMNVLDSDDMRQHRRIGKYFIDAYGGICVDMTDHQLASGHFYMIQKSLWKEMGGVTRRGMLGCDNEIHQKIRVMGERLYLIKSLYIFHWYFGDSLNGERNTDHLKKSNG